MKITRLTLISSAFLIIAACHSSKKGTASTVSSTPASTTTTTTTPASTPPFSVARSADGIYPPGNQELAAVQAKYTQYKDVTLDKLMEGYTLYTAGACIKCHSAQNIYRHDETEWYRIIVDMSLKARITDSEQDAVFKYVFAIKAAQAK